MHLQTPLNYPLALLWASLAFRQIFTGFQLAFHWLSNKFPQNFHRIFSGFSPKQVFQERIYLDT